MESQNIQQGIIIEKVSEHNWTLEVKNLGGAEVADALLGAYCKSIRVLIGKALLTPELAKEVTMKQLNELLDELLGE